MQPWDKGWNTGMRPSALQSINPTYSLRGRTQASQHIQEQHNWAIKNIIKILIKFLNKDARTHTGLCWPIIMDLFIMTTWNFMLRFPFLFVFSWCTHVSITPDKAVFRFSHWDLRHNMSMLHIFFRCFYTVFCFLNESMKTYNITCLITTFHY